MFMYKIRNISLEPVELKEEGIVLRPFEFVMLDKKIEDERLFVVDVVEIKNKKSKKTKESD